MVGSHEVVKENTCCVVILACIMDSLVLEMAQKAVDNITTRLHETLQPSNSASK